MFIAMNRFRIVEGREASFEETWQTRNRYVQDVEGFVDFKLLRGETGDGVTPYVSHSTWTSKEAFVAWTRGEAFQKAHRDARSPEGTLAGPPAFSGWDVVLQD